MIRESSLSMIVNKGSGARNNSDLTTLFYQIILNDDIFQQLKELLNNTCNGTNNLLNVSRDFEESKKAYFYWELNRQYSLLYYSSSPFRERIALLINTKRQLSLNLSDYSQVVGVTVLIDVNALDLTECENVIDVSQLGGLHVLNLTSCQRVVNVSALGQVHDLCLCDCRHLVDVSTLGRVFN
jgi:hypothetical protein